MSQIMESEALEDSKPKSLIERFNELKKAGQRLDNEFNCLYYFGQVDSRLWWNETYPNALKIKRKLAQETIDLLLEEHYMVRDSYRINRISHAIKDIDKMLADEPEEKFINKVLFTRLMDWLKKEK